MGIPNKYSLCKVYMGALFKGTLLLKTFPSGSRYVLSEREFPESNPMTCDLYKMVFFDQKNPTRKSGPGLWMVLIAEINEPYPYYPTRWFIWGWLLSIQFPPKKRHFPYENMCDRIWPVIRVIPLLVSWPLLWTRPLAPSCSLADRSSG